MPLSSSGEVFYATPQLSCVPLQGNPIYQGVKVRKVSKLMFGDIAVMYQRTGNVSRSAEGGTSGHATQPLVISISESQVTEMYLFQTTPAL